MSIIKLAKINQEIVKAIPLFGKGEIDNRPVKGKELFEEVYANILNISSRARWGGEVT